MKNESEKRGVMKKIAVITGADGGLGREYTRLILEESNVDEIWALAKTPARLQRLVQDFGARIVPVEIDLTQLDALADFHRRLSLEKPEIRWLINNAGIGKFGSFEKMEALEAARIVDLNCRAVVEMTWNCLPYMPPGSRIVNTASQAAFQPLPYFSVYAASKAFIDRFSLALAVELKPRGITVTSVCPCWMRTPLLNKAQTTARPDVVRMFPITDPAPVARAAISDSQKGRRRSVYGALTRLAILGAKLLPTGITMAVWLMQQGLNGMHVWHCPHPSKPGEAEMHCEMLKLLETSIQASHAGMPR